MLIKTNYYCGLNFKTRFKSGYLLEAEVLTLDEFEADELVLVSLIVNEERREEQSR